MGDKPAAERACKDPNPIIDGRKANVNLAILGAKPRGNLQTSKCILSFLKLAAIYRLMRFCFVLHTFYAFHVLQPRQFKYIYVPINLII